MLPRLKRMTMKGCWLVAMLVIALCGDGLASCKDQPEPGVNWHGCDLTGRDLKGVDLSGANLMGAKLSNANLSGSTLG